MLAVIIFLVIGFCISTMDITYYLKESNANMIMNAEDSSSSDEEEAAKTKKQLSKSLPAKRAQVRIYNVNILARCTGVYFSRIV